MIFEPRLVGHHLSWLRYVTEDFLHAGLRLTWAVDYRPKAKIQIQEQLSTLIPHVSVISVFDEAGRLRCGSKIRAMADCMRESRARDVFLNSLDEVTSNCLRYAALGIYPPRLGLHLVVNAMADLPSESRFFLLCAGHIPKDRKTMKRLQQLKGHNLATTLNRYVLDAEGELCFCAGDAVLLPYIKHFGSSGVLSRAAASGTMVIVSDEELIARRTRDHNLGLLFPSGNVKALNPTSCFFAILGAKFYHFGILGRVISIG